MKGSSGHDDLSIHREGLRVFRYLALALALIATSGWAQQTRYVEEAGEDTSDCSASPCASIQYAIDQSAAGDTIEVGAGTYVGELHIHLDDLTLVSVAGADDTIVDADDSINGIEIGDHSHPGNHPDGVTVEGFQVINWVERGISQRNGTGTVFIRDNILLGPESGARNGINISGGTGSEVTGNEIVTSSFDQDNWSGTGILAMGSVNALIEHNLISGPDIGVAVVGGFSSVDPAWAQASGNIVRDNTITGSSSGAIGLQGDAGGTLIEDNELIDNNRGIEVSESGHGAYPSDVEIRGNFIADNGTGIAFFDPGSHDPGQLTVEDNVFEGNQLNLGDGTGTIDDQDFEQNNEINQLVRLVATDGEDSGNCSEDACLTIQYAVNQAAPGDTISIASGTYREQVGISKSLIIDADPGAVLEAPDTMSVIEFPENSDEWVPMMLVYGGSLSGGEITGSSVVDVDVSGLEFDGRDLSHSERFPAILYRNANGLIANNSIHSMGNLEGNESFGVSVYGDSIVEVVNNHITGYGRGGIGIQGSDGPYPHPDGLVVGNTLVGIGYGENQPSGANAIQVAWGATGAVMDNTVTGGWHEDADVAGVFVGLGSDDVVVADNYLAGNGAGVQVYDASGTEITGNVIEDGDYGMDIGYGNSDTVIDGNEIRNQFLDGILVWTQSTAITNTQITNNLIEESDWGLTLFVNEPGEIDGIDVTANHFVDNNRQLVDNAELLDEQDFLAANTFDITLTLDLSTGLPSALESGSGWAGFTAQLTSVGEVPENVLLWIEVDGIDNSNVEDLTLQYYNPAIDDWSTFGWGGFGGGDFPEMDREGYFIGRDGSTLVGFEIPAGYDENIPLRVDWPNGSYPITVSIESFEVGAANDPGDRIYLSQTDTLDVASLSEGIVVVEGRGAPLDGQSLVQGSATDALIAVDDAVVRTGTELAVMFDGQRPGDASPQPGEGVCADLLGAGDCQALGDAIGFDNLIEQNGSIVLFDDEVSIREDAEAGQWLLRFFLVENDDGSPGEVIDQLDITLTVLEPDTLGVDLGGLQSSYVQGAAQSGSEQAQFVHDDPEGVGTIEQIFNVFVVLDDAGDPIDQALYDELFVSFESDPLHYIRGLSGTTEDNVVAPDTIDVDLLFELKTNAPVGTYTLVLTSYDVTGVDAGDVSLADALGGAYPVLASDSSDPIEVISASDDYRVGYDFSGTAGLSAIGPENIGDPLVPRAYPSESSQPSTVVDDGVLTLGTTNDSPVFGDFRIAGVRPQLDALESPVRSQFDFFMNDPANRPYIKTRFRNIEGDNEGRFLFQAIAGSQVFLISINDQGEVVRLRVDEDDIMGSFPTVDVSDWNTMRIQMLEDGRVWLLLNGQIIYETTESFVDFADPDSGNITLEVRDVGASPGNASVEIAEFEYGILADAELSVTLVEGLPDPALDESGWAGFTANLANAGGDVPENVLLWIEVDGIDNSNVEDLTLQYYNPAIDDWSTFGWGGFGGGDFPEMDREGYFIGRDGSTLVGFEIPAGYDELIPLRVDWPNGSYQITTSIESFEDGAENNPGDRLYLSQADTLDVVSEPDELEVALESFDPSYLQGDSQAGTEQVVFDFIDNDGGNIKYVFNVFQVFEAGTGNEIDYAAVFADVSFDPEQIRGLTGTDAGVVTAPGDLEDVAVSFTLQPDAPLGDYDIVITSFDVTGIDAGDVTLADALAGEYPVLDDDSVQIALDQAEGQIAGLVELSGAGAPLITVEGLEVTATRDSAVVASDTTDASGAYSLEGLPAGTYNVAVESLEGLTTADAEVTLASSADEQSQDFVLESTVTGAFAATAGGVGIDAQTFAAGRSIEDVDLSVTRDDGGATLDFYVSLLVFDSQWQQIDYTQPDVLFTEQTLQALANVLGPDGEFTLAGNDSEVVLDGAELELAEGADALDVSVFRFRLVDARYGDPGNRLKHFRDDYGVTIAPQDELGVALAGFEPEYQRGAMETGSEQVVFDYTANAGDIEQVFNVFTVLEGGVEIDPGTYEEIFESVEFVPAQIRGLTGTDASVVTAPGDLDVVSVQFLLEEDAPLGDYEIVITSYDVTGIDPDDVALGDTDTYRVLDTASQAMSLIQGPELELTIDGPELLSLAEEGDYDVRLQNTGDAEVGENVEVQFAIARAGIEPGDVVVDYCIDETATSGEDCADWAELTLEADNGSLSGRFGPGDGFEVDEDYDRTTFIRAAFTEPGNYDASAQAVGVDSDEVYATGMTEVAITELAFDIEAGVDQAVPTPDEGEGWAYYTATLVNLGDELPELVRLFIEVHDSDGQLIDDAFDFEFWNTTTETWDSLAWDADDQRWAFGPASGFVIDDEYEAATPVRVNFSNDLYDLAVSVETADQQADTVWVYGEFEEQIGVISEAVNLDFDIERGVQAPDQPPRWDYFTATLSNIDGGATPDDIVLYVAVDETDFAAGDALEFWNGSEWQNFGWDADREAWFLGRDGAGGVSGFPIDADEVFEIEIRVNFLPDVYTGTITVESFDDSIVGVGGVYGEFVESVEVLPTPADITFDAGDLVQTFDGTEKSVGVTTAPEPGLDVEFIFDPAPPVDAGSYAVTATVIDPYFEGDATETLVIEPAEAQVMLDDLVQVFDGEPKPVSVTTDPAGLNVNITYDGDSQVPTNAGEYSVVAEIDDPNYTGQADATLVIEQAPVELFFEDLTQVYDGDPKQVTVTTDPQGVDVAVTYDGSSDAPVDAGSYLVVAEVVDPNYEPISDNAVFVIEPGQAEVILSDLTQVYDSGNPLPVTVETVPAGLAVTVTYDGGSQAPGEAGSYSVFASVDDANWTGTASGLLVIEPAEAAIMLDGLEQTYDGTPREVTATTDPAGLAVEITYDGQAMPPVDAGSYEVVATVDDANHVGSVTDTLVVAQAEVDEIQINDLEQVHDGEPKPVTVITLPAGLDVTITYDGQETPPVDAGSYLVEVEVVDNNYFGSADDTLVVEQGEQTIDFPVLPDRSVDDSPFTITASASSGLAVSFDVVSGPATIDGDTVTLTGELGEVVIEANQPGDDNWQPADPVQQSFEVVEGDGNTIEAVSATTIGGEAGEPVDAADLPTVRVLDEADNPVSGVTVSFEVTSGGGSISGATQVTDSDGLAQVEEWVLGGEAVQTLTASAPGLAGSPVEFTAEVDAVVNLEISITDNRDTIEPGERNTYVIVVSNEGPNEADGANVIVELPAELLADSADWVCYAGPAATCTDSGTGGIDDTVMLEAGANVIYVLEADVDDQATGIVEVTASVTLDEVVAEDVTTTQIVITEDSIFQDRFESDDEPEGSVNADASRIEGHLMISGNYRGGLPPRVLLGGRDGDGNDVFRIRSLAFEHLALVRVELRDEHGFWSHGEWLAMQPAEEGVLGFEYDAESGLLILAGDSADDLVQSRSTAPVAHELFTESSDQVEIVIEQ